MFRFANPYAFFLLVPLGLAMWFVYRRRVCTGILFAPTHRIPAKGSSLRSMVANTLPILLAAGLLLAIVALARPQNVFSTTRRSTDAIAIEMVVDVSGSMEALDLSVRSATGTRYRTRLDAVKETFAEFVEERPDDLIGLVTFGGYASTRAPLTLDHQALLHTLGGIDIPKQTYDKQGQVVNREELLTAIGDAIATACARLEHAEPQSRILVLLSDGESNTGVIEPLEAVKIAQRLGIRIYTIGVGTTGTAPFWGRDMLGRQRQFQARVVLDEALLRRIAKNTDGKYFNVRDPKGLDRAMAEINKLEKTEIERELYSTYDELYQRFLTPGLLAVALATLLSMMVAGRIV